MPANLIRWVTRLLLAGFLVLLLTTLVMQRRRILVLTGEVATLREENRDVAKLRQDSAEIEKLRNENQEVERLRKDVTDLPRLRNEAHQLREAKAEVTTLRGANEQLRASLAAREAGPPIAAVVSDAPELYTRTFKLNRAAMLALAADGQTQPATNLSAAVKLVLTKAGVDIIPPKSIFYSDGKGMLMVRATLPELDAIEQLLPTLNLTAPEAPAP